MKVSEVNTIEAAEVYVEGIPHAYMRVIIPSGTFKGEPIWYAATAEGWVAGVGETGVDRDELEQAWQMLGRQEQQQ